MKRSWITALFALMLWPAGVSAQGMDFASFFQKYNGREDCTTVELTGEMLRFLGKSPSGSTSGDYAYNDFGINGIRIAVNEPASAEFAADMRQVAAGEFYKLLSSVTKNGKTTGIYYKDASYSNKRKSELLLIVVAAGKNIAIDITGDLDIKNISNIQAMGLDGL